MAIDWYLTAKMRRYGDPHDMFMHLYVTNENTIPLLAKEFECSTSTIRAALNRFKIPIRPHGGPRVKRR